MPNIVLTSDDPLIVKTCKGVFKKVAGANIISVPVLSKETVTVDQELDVTHGDLDDRGGDAIEKARALSPGADCYVHAEEVIISGSRQGSYLATFAVSVAQGATAGVSTFSSMQEGINVPSDCIEEARQRNCSVMSVVHERGIGEEPSENREEGLTRREQKAWNVIERGTRLPRLRM